VTDIHINFFRDEKDTIVDPSKGTWEEIVSFFTRPHEIIESKTDAKLFNLAHYKALSQVPNDPAYWIHDNISGLCYVRRKQVNLIENHCFVIDYDDTISIAEVKEQFKDYEYILYTSYRHLHDDKTEKFRIIIPFTTPIPTYRNIDEYGNIVDEGDWYVVKESLKQLTGPCDNTSFNPNTIYNLPSCPSSRVDKSFSEHHKGKSLDWAQLEKTKSTSTSSSNTDTLNNNIDKGYLSPDTILHTKTGDIKLSEVTGTVEGVTCPNPEHNDQKGSEFAKKVEHTGNIFVYCKKCEKSFFMRNESTSSSNEDSPLPDKAQKRTDKIRQKIKQEKFLDEIFEKSDDKTYEDPEDRELVKKELNKIKNIINEDVGYTRGLKTAVTIDLPTRKYKSHIIYMTEGAGKSRLVLDMANDGQKIIFACKSWEQVESKYKEYTEAGKVFNFGVKIVRSKDAKARYRFNTKVIRGEQKYPFTPAKILDEETIDAIIKTNPDLSPDFIRLSWQFFGADKLSFNEIPYQYQEGPDSFYEDEISPSLADNDTRIILTTFEQLRIHRLKNIYIPKDWLIWLDDPDMSDVVDIEPYDTKKWDELSDDQFEKKTREVNGKTYFRRHPKQSLGDSLKQYKCIYTTTESITLRGIELMMKNRQEEFITHDKMYNISGGHITILGTEMVRKRYDGIIPLLARRLTKEKYPTTLIADGLSTEINHSNNKGRNDLSKTNLLVELSIPHPAQTRTYCDSLSLPFRSNRTEITRSIILDKLHQAIGRNSGYRWHGFECVVLVDKGVHKNIVDETRYRIDEENSVIIDRTKSMSSQDARTSDSVSPIVQRAESFLNNVYEYISDNRKIKPDIEFVFKSITEQQKKLSYAVRLIVALSQIPNIEIKEGFVEPANLSTVQNKYWNIITWITENHIPKESLKYVNKEVRETIKEFS
jgi:hypothetical protein